MKKLVKDRLQEVTTATWIRFAVAVALIIGFALWLQSLWVLLILPFAIDNYLTRYLPWGFWRKSKSAPLRQVLEWVDAILYALVAVYLINTFFFQNYQIPTSSLEKSLYVGDHLLVSKLSYGSRVPNTPLSFPLAQHTMPVTGTKSYIEHPQLPYKRLLGLGKVDRGEIVVFNFPAGDTVATLAQNPDIYTLAYNEGRANFHTDTTGMHLSTYAYNKLLTQLGREIIARNKDRYGEIITRPVDRRENYVKRAVGLPGNTLEIKANQVYIDGKPMENPKKLQQNYYFMTDGTKLGEQNFRELGISEEDRYLIHNNPQANGMLNYLGFTPNANGSYNPVYQLPLTQESLTKVKAYPFVTKVVIEPGEFGGDVFPLGYNEEWTRSDYGPVWIPKKGESVALTLDNLQLYERPIVAYEGNTLAVKDNKIYINGKESKEYTFKMDYYFMMGDNRDKSADSRYWGFVPEDHIVGKPLLVWLSFDKDRSLWDGGIRFDRLFKWVAEKQD